jgi:hypothetical protein
MRQRRAGGERLAQAPHSIGDPLELSPELREHLGLDPEESVRLLHGDRCTLVLERVDANTSAVLPLDRALVLTADVRAFPLADCLGLVHGAGKSGLLFFSHRDHAKSVYFHRGEVVFATSNVKADRIGQCLLRASVITLEQLREAERCFKPPGRFGKVLVERGFLTPRELWQGVKNQVEDLVRSLFSYIDGHVYFWDGEIQPDNVVRLSLPTNRLVAEGIERRDELFKFLERLESPNLRLERNEEFGAYVEGNEGAVFEALAGEPTFSRMCREADLDPLSAARTVQLLHGVGAVKLVPTPNAAASAAEDDADALAAEEVTASVLGHVKLLDELAAPIVAVEGTGPLCERLQRVVVDTGQRFPELLGGIRLGPNATLDPSELEQRAMQLPGDRVHIIGAALGELVTYLEFELRNHPKLDDPELFLSALADLRAKIGA